MYISVFNNPESVTAAEWEEEYRRLPLWRQQKVAAYRFLLDRVLATKAYMLLNAGLAEGYGIHGEWHFAYTDNHKPVLQEYPHIHFNLSHCRKGVLCVIHDRPVGCDIEEIPPDADMALMRHSCSPKEIDAIFNSAAPAAAFAKLWTQKEAFLKFTGEGITANMPDLFVRKSLAALDVQSCVQEEYGCVYSIITDKVR